MTGQSGDGYPEGTVTLYYGTTPVALCSETLPDRQWRQRQLQLLTDG